MANNRSNGPALTWTNIISTAVFGVMMIGAFWTVMLTLFTAERERTNLINTFHDKEIELLARAEKDKAHILATADKEKAGILSDINKERRDLLQQQLDRRENEISRRLIELTVQVNAQRSEFMTVKEFVQFRASIDQIRDELKIIATTRPTTGELQAIARATTDAADKMEQRVRSLEDNLRTLRVPPAPAH